MPMATFSDRLLEEARLERLLDDPLLDRLLEDDLLYSFFDDIVTVYYGV